MNIDALENALRKYGGRDLCKADADCFRKFLHSAPEVFERSHPPGHFTGSAWLVSADGTRVLLMHHRKLDRWLQPGGHADGDTDLARVALREAQEETGVADLRVEGDIFDIDRHRIAGHVPVAALTGRLRRSRSLQANAVRPARTSRSTGTTTCVMCCARARTNASRSTRNPMHWHGAAWRKWPVTPASTARCDGWRANGCCAIAQAPSRISRVPDSDVRRHHRCAPRGIRSSDRTPAENRARCCRARNIPRTACGCSVRRTTAGRPSRR